MDEYILKFAPKTNPSTQPHRREEALNTTFSQSEFTLDQGERLLKGMQTLREELNAHGVVVSKLVEDAQEIRPVKQRRLPITRPLRADTVCAYKHANVSYTVAIYYALFLRLFLST